MLTIARALFGHDHLFMPDEKAGCGVADSTIQK